MEQYQSSIPHYPRARLSVQAGGGLTPSDIYTTQTPMLLGFWITSFAGRNPSLSRPFCNPLGEGMNG